MKIRELFDKCATKYDQDRPKLVPSFDDFYGIAISIIPFSAETNFRVLDLGAGTGLLAAMVAQEFPKAMLHLTDISEAMLSQARQRFSDNPLVTYSVQDHLELSGENRYDLVISALSIHHLENRDKKILFQKIYRALRSGGRFINADQVLAPSPSGEEFYEKQWIRDVTSNGITEVVLEQARERMMEDKNALLSDQMMWLSQSGFADVDCWYKRFRFVVYGAVKIKTG